MLLGKISERVEAICPNLIKVVPNCSMERRMRCARLTALNSCFEHSDHLVGLLIPLKQIFINLLSTHQIPIIADYDIEDEVANAKRVLK